jgi:hypothetical protein
VFVHPPDKLQYAPAILSAKGKMSLTSSSWGWSGVDAGIEGT